MVHCHVCKHLDSTEPVKLETCIVVTLSSWKIELTFFISKSLIKVALIISIHQIILIVLNVFR